MKQFIQIFTAENALLQVEARATIHARAVRGRHMRWRWAMFWLTQLVFYGLPWLQVKGHPAVWFDLSGLRFFLFGAVLFPQDLVWLAALLIGCALLLFFATTLAGRVWCGFVCPQTVYTGLFTWIEYRCEGDRRAREQLDRASWGPEKCARRGAKYALWSAASLWSGVTLVGYFTPVRELLVATPDGLGSWEIFWVIFYALAMVGNAGFLREKVCLHMCPYGRFQGSLMDAHTLNVSYDAIRGEPRRSRAAGADTAADANANAFVPGSCVDCTLCVQACPTGIDIRHGLQAGCINCGLCIDACDAVMDKMGQARGLIRFASLHELSGPFAAANIAPLWMRLMQQMRRPRVALYACLLLAIGVSLVVGLVHHPRIRLDSMRDRSVMSRVVEGGAVENLYQLLLINASNDEQRVQLSAQASRLGALTLEPAAPVTLAPAQTFTTVVRVRIPQGVAQARAGETVPVTFIAATGTQGGLAKAESLSTFLIPR